MATRQFGAHGAVLLWRVASDGGPRRGLLCMPNACAQSDCFAIHVWLGEVDSMMLSVSHKGNALEFVRDAGGEKPARVPGSEAFASYDTEKGSVVAAEGSEKSALVEWLIASADADVLTHLRTPLMQREMAAGRVMKRRSGT